MNEYHAPRRKGYTPEQIELLDAMLEQKEKLGPVKEMPASVVLVGGTNGKTTTTKLLYHIRSVLDPLLQQDRMASDIDQGYEVNVIEEFFRIWKNNVHLIIEAWSFGWKLFRYDVMLCEYSKDNVVSIITNLTQDHGNYHDYDMDVYAAAKFRTVEFSRLLVLHESLWPYYEKFGNHIPVLVFGEGSRSDVKIDQDAFTVKHWSYRFAFERPLHLLGYHNCLNVVGACILAMEPWITADDEETAVSQWPKIQMAIASFEKVPGRMEMYTSTHKSILCISDYAHNPGGMEAVLQAVKPLVPAKKSLWCIFGCNEKKDVKKRPMMGRAALLFADKVVITSDHECVQGFQFVVDDILEGNNPQDKLMLVMEDRVKAIRTTLDMADPEDVVLICNMGTDLHTCIAWDQDHTMTQSSVFSLRISGDVIPHAGLDFPFSLLPQDDRVIMNLCNLEGTLSLQDGFSSGFPCFAAPLSWAPMIARHFQVISVANNHCLDYGKTGLHHTAALLRQQGALVVGDTKSYGLFVHPATAVRVGIFCYTTLSNQPCSWVVTDGHQFARDRLNFKVDYGDADIYVAYMHWGDEFDDTVSDHQLFLKQELVEKHGFDIVVGCHAHVAQSVNMVGQTCIFGLGNLVSNHATTRFEPDTDAARGITVQYDFEKDVNTKETVLTGISSFYNGDPSTRMLWPIRVPTEDVELPFANNTSMWIELDLRSSCAHHFKYLLAQGYFIDTMLTYGTADYDVGGMFMGFHDTSRRIKASVRWDPPLQGIGFLEHAEGEVGAWFMVHYNRGRNVPRRTVVHWFGRILTGTKLEPHASVPVASYPTSKPSNDQGPLTYQRLERITHGEWWKRPPNLKNYGNITFQETVLDTTKVWVCEHPLEIMGKSTDHLLGVLIVKDRVAALRAAARDCTLRFTGPIIRITGSSGKTTTRCITARLLQEAYQPQEILSNAMNYNNTIGVPQTVIMMTDHTKIMVIEMGISEPFEMFLLTATVHGSISVLLNVQHAHEANFDSHEHLVQEKSMIQRNNAGIFLDLHRNPLQVPPHDHLSPGRAKALAAALEICRLVNVDPTPATISDTIAEMNELIPAGRAHLYFHDPIWILDDTYNGNPDSIANMIHMCLHHPFPLVIILAEVAECPPKYVTEIVGNAIKLLAHRDDVYLFLGGQMFDWVQPHIKHTYRFQFDNSISHICSLLQTEQSLLAIKGTGLFKKDPRWKMWEWLHNIKQSL